MAKKKQNEGKPKDQESKIEIEGGEETAEGSESKETEEKEEKEEDAAGSDSAAENTADEAAEPEEATDKAVKKTGEDEKSRLFKKKEKKDKRDEKIEELNDRVKRQMAEFENFRKRTEREKSQSFELGARSVIEKVLPVIDNFERGLAAVPEDKKGDPFVEGMDKIYKQLLSELENIGVKPIEAVGKEFDPEFHNAVMQVESEEYESGIVAQEMQKGYLFRDSVVRHSMVAVVQ